MRESRFNHFVPLRLHRCDLRAEINTFETETFFKTREKEKYFAGRIREDKAIYALVIQLDNESGLLYAKRKLGSGEKWSRKSFRSQL